MSKDMKQDLHALQTLLDTAIDGERGFTQAIKSCEGASEHFVEYLEKARHSCQLAKDELRSMMASCGEVEDEGGTIPGSLHRGWIAAKTTFSPNEEAAFAAEIVRGEEHATKVYEEELAKLTTQPFRTAVEGQLLGLRDNLTKARAFSKHLQS